MNSLSLAVVLATFAATATATPAPVELRTEYLSAALGIDTPHPRFSWKLPAVANRNTSLAAYQIAVLRDNVTIWDTGAVASRNTLFVPYAGQALEPDTSYQWAVRWQAVNDSAWSPYATQPFDTALFSDGDWRNATWVGSATQRMLQRNFTLPTGASRARLYVGGCATWLVNGGDGGDGSRWGLCPWSQFDKRVFYTTHDVTSLLQPGTNTLTIFLGHGMRGHFKLGSPTVRVLLSVQFASRFPPVFVASQIEDGWMAAAGPFISDDPFDGCVQDLRFYASPPPLTPLVAGPPPGVGASKALMMPLVGVVARLPAIRSHQLPNSNYVFDFGENLVGVVEIAVSGPSGSAISVRHGEFLDDTGAVAVNTSGWLLPSFQIDTYILAGHAGTFRPSFTWHGFQFIEVNVSGGAIFSGLLSAVTAVKLASAIATTGTTLVFGDDAQSDGAGALLSQMHTLVQRSQLANVAVYLPTDCPTREKHGWLGDAQVTAEEALYNFDVGSIYTAFLNTVADSQSSSGDVQPVVPTTSPQNNGASMAADISWTAAFVLIANWTHMYYGDEALLAAHYPALQRYMANLDALAVNETGQLADFFTWGDWCAVQDRAIATPATGPELAAFNWILSLDAMANIATILQLPADSAKYTARAQTARASFHTRFYNASMGLYNGGFDLDAQSLTAAPLALGNTIPSHLADSVVAALVANIASFDNHLTFGSVGAKHLLPQLSAHGQHALAMTIATQQSYPGFGHWLAQGATSCWENWSGYPDASHPPQPTHNHIFLCGGLGEWMWRSVAGIAPAAPGFSEIRIAPQILASGGPGSANASLETVRGTVQAAWTREHNATTGQLLAIRLTVVVPTGCTAFVTPVPLELRGGLVALWERDTLLCAKMDNVAVQPAPGIWEVECAAATVKVGSGRYSFHGPFF